MKDKYEKIKKKVIFQRLFKLLYVGLEYHIDSSANQSNYTVGNNHPVHGVKHDKIILV